VPALPRASAVNEVLSQAQITRYAARLQGVRLLPILREWQIRRAVRRLARDASSSALDALRAGVDTGLLREKRYRNHLDVALILDADQSRAERIRAFFRVGNPEATTPSPEPAAAEQDRAIAIGSEGEEPQQPSSKNPEGEGKRAGIEETLSAWESEAPDAERQWEDETPKPEEQEIEDPETIGGVPEAQEIEHCEITEHEETVLELEPTADSQARNDPELLLTEHQQIVPEKEEDSHKEFEHTNEEENADDETRDISTNQEPEYREKSDHEESLTTVEHPQDESISSTSQRIDAPPAEGSPAPTTDLPAQLPPPAAPRRQKEERRPDRPDRWTGSDGRDRGWDPQDDPDYPWISKLDRFVRLDPDERRMVIARIAQSDLTVDDWIEILLHQEDDSNAPKDLSTNPHSFEAMLEDLWYAVPSTLDHSTAEGKEAISEAEPSWDEDPKKTQSRVPTTDEQDRESPSSVQVAQAELSATESVGSQPSLPTNEPARSASFINALLLDDWNEETADPISAVLLDCASKLLGRAAEDQRNPHDTLLAGLLSFHLREKQAQDNQFIAHLAMNDEALEQDSACLARAALVSCEAFRPNKHLATYRYDPRQPFRLSVRDNKTERLVCQSSRVNLELYEVLANEGLVKLSLKSVDANSLQPDSNLIHRPNDIAGLIRGALAEQAHSWVEDPMALPPAVSHLLSRRGEDRFRLLAKQGRDAPEQTAQLISDALFAADGISLILQGPPGTGKTTCAAEVITRLVDAGWNVGICANSHLAIDHLLHRTAERARSAKQTVSLAKFQGRMSKEDRHVFTKAGIDVIDAASFHTKYDVYGATAYGFCHQRFEGLLDLLVIDEASQVSLANLLAMGRCARNLLLVGDQQQLAQPTLAEHPGESGLSCLSYATEGDPVIADHRGVFLSRSWRMPPTLCGFVSEQFYSQRLEAHPANSANGVEWTGAASGLQFEAVEHSENHVYSLEEAEMIEGLVKQLLGCAFRRESAVGTVNGTISPADIAIMAPFNAQVTLLQRKLGRAAQVGTVDRFQGREAPVSIYSVTTSRSISTRGLEFVLDANRVNVAISRAQCLAIVVASPFVASLLQSSDTLQREAQLFRSLSAHQHPATTQK